MPLAITADIVGFGKLGNPHDVYGIIISTNQKIQRTALKIICPQDFDVMGWSYSSGENPTNFAAAEGRSRENNRSFPINLVKPAFEPGKHILLLIALTGPPTPYFQCFVDQVTAS